MTTVGLCNLHRGHVLLIWLSLVQTASKNMVKSDPLTFSATNYAQRVN